MSTIFSRNSTNETKTEKYNITQGRPDVIDNDLAKDLNSYRFWGRFTLRPEPVNTPGKNEQGKVENPELLSMTGTKSLFNNVNAVPFNTLFQINNNAPLTDNQIIRKRIRMRGDCSVRELVRASKAGEMGRSIYNYSDFMYCKYLGRMSNNYLVTLRRFPYPVDDNITYIKQNYQAERQVKQPMPDIGRLVTWMGTPGNGMSNILKYSVLMPYKEMTADIQELNGSQAESGGLLGSIMNLSSPSYVSETVQGRAGASTIGVAKGLTASLLPSNKNFNARGVFNSSIANTHSNASENQSWRYHIDQSKPYGPVDVISKTHIRQSGKEGGLEFNQEISLVFDYELRSYDNINTKAAFLDLIGNILAVTYTNGKFWGGGFHQNGVSQSNAFTNLALWNLGKDGKPVTLSSLGDSILTSISQIGAAFNNGKPISSGGDLVNAMKNLASSLGNILLGGALNALGRPQKQALNSLLSPAPVGLWHLTIGNPKHPIMSMGNMILTGVDISHYGPLGLDDFPTGIKVEIKLKHAKPRDIGGIERMYMFGDYRIYSPMGKYVMDMYNNASAYKQNTSKDTSNTVEATNKLDAVNKDGVKTSTEYKQTNEETKKILMKFFGDTDSKRILWAGDEGFMGSQKAITAEEAAEHERQLANATNKDKNGSQTTSGTQPSAS